jgi:hypothetical protein
LYNYTFSHIINALAAYPVREAFVLWAQIRIPRLADSALVLDLLLSNAPKAVVPKDEYIHSDNLVALSIRLTLCPRIKIAGLEAP